MRSRAEGPHRPPTYVALLVATLAAGSFGACSTGGDDPAPGAASPGAAPPAPPPARIALAPQRPAEFFPGSDQSFLGAVRQELDGVEAPASDADMVDRGRELCSVLSGGGAVADKVDFWSGSFDLGDPAWDAVFRAATTTYCRELADGFRADRTEEIEPTAAERADLARFVVRQGLGVTAFDTASDAEVADDAEGSCQTVRADPETLGRWVDSGDLSPLMHALGAVTAYCPELSDHVRSTLSDLTTTTS